MLKLKAFFLHILWNQSTAFIRMNLNEADAIKQILLWNCFQMILWSCWFHKFFREIYFKWFSKFVSISRIFLEIFLQNGFQVSEKRLKFGDFFREIDFIWIIRLRQFHEFFPKIYSQNDFQQFSILRIFSVELIWSYFIRLHQFHECFKRNPSIKSITKCK